MVGGNFTTARGDKEEDVSMLAGDFDVSFVAAVFVVDITFESQVEVMAIGGSSLSIVEDRLIRYWDAKDLSQNLGCFPGCDCKRDMKCQHQSQDIGRVVDFIEVDF